MNKGPHQGLYSCVSTAFGRIVFRGSEGGPEKVAITADTDLRLAHYFGLSEGFFLRLQAAHDLIARQRQIGDKLKAIKPRAA